MTLFGPNDLDRTPDPAPASQRDEDSSHASDPGPRLYAGVALENSLDRVLDYSVPRKLLEQIMVGQRVRVPLGSTNRPSHGYVVRLRDHTKFPRIKPLSGIDDDRVLIDPHLMKLARWMSRYYVCPLGAVIESILPSAVKKKTGMAYTPRVRLNRSREEIQALLEKTRAPKRRAILARLLLLEPDASIELFRLASEAGSTPATVKKLAGMGLIRITAEVDLPRMTARGESAALPPGQKLELNPDQQRVLDDLQPHLAGGFSVHLILGVTGSGKTEVYLQAIDQVVKAGKQAIVLVPEIALTPQTVRRFTQRFERVCVLHSGLGGSDRHRQWQQIAQGDAQVVVGARSGVFAPTRNLGIIIIDEEHEASYKQDQLPRYNARDVAIKRAQMEQIPIVLGSATPSLETYYKVRSISQRQKAAGDLVTASQVTSSATTGASGVVATNAKSSSALSHSDMPGGATSRNAQANRAMPNSAPSNGALSSNATPNIAPSNSVPSSNALSIAPTSGGEGQSAAPRSERGTQSAKAAASREIQGNAVGTGDDGEIETASTPASRPVPVYRLHRLPNRVRNLAMPTVELVDMAGERKLRKGVHLLSVRLEHLLKHTLSMGQQAILLLNRRGYSNFIYCPSCADPIKCKYCDATMTYHRSAGTHVQSASMDAGVHTGQMHCHYCLAVQSLPATCPTCGKKLTLFGLGTQRVEEELARKMPDVKFARVDGDTMRNVKDYEALLRKFAAGEIQVMLGTQMIAKGLDYPNVTLVGVISGDTALALPDFRAAERTFQLITQVAGRAGRGDKPGRVVLQTFLPQDPTILSAKNQDYDGFAERELSQRHEVGLPPYARIARIILRDTDEMRLHKLSETLAMKLSEAITAQQTPSLFDSANRAASTGLTGTSGSAGPVITTPPITSTDLCSTNAHTPSNRQGTSPGSPDVGEAVSPLPDPLPLSLKGPMPCAISRIAGYHRVQIVLTSPRADLLQNILATLRGEGALTKTDRIAVDVDPVSLL